MTIPSFFIKVFKKLIHFNILQLLSKKLSLCINNITDMGTKNFILELYDYDHVDKSFIIKLSPEKYLDIFNNLDYYPIRKRDISPNVINYIEDCSSDIPAAANIKIEITIKKEKKNEDVEERTRKGIRNYFLYILAIYKKNSRESIINALLYIVVFLVISITMFTLEATDIHISTVFLNTIKEGFSIGSWVFLWEAIASLTIKNRTNRTRMRMYHRLVKSLLVFRYLETDENYYCSQSRRDS